jgi:hypothetical protein
MKKNEQCIGISAADPNQGSGGFLPPGSGMNFFLIQPLFW